MAIIVQVIAFFRVAQHLSIHWVNETNERAEHADTTLASGGAKRCLGSASKPLERVKHAIESRVFYTLSSSYSNTTHFVSLRV